jgi:hypothetical protein
MDRTIEEVINQRRRQILIHSFLYYKMNMSIIDDYKFDMFAKELAELQNKYPEIASKCVYSEVFIDFDGSTGFDLDMSDPWIQMKAIQILNIHEKDVKHGN